jgi:aspartate racemase
MTGKLGVLGGMGPLASAEFMTTLYRLNITEPEQEAPVCLLLSDPSFPDRTEAILNGATALLTARLTAALQDLADRGADRIVIACVTAHHFLYELPPALRQKIVSLIDLVIDEMVAVPGRRLLLTTTGTRTARIFERHERWAEVAGQVVYPTAEDQVILHNFLYRLKCGDSGRRCAEWVGALPARYGVAGCIFGCTELHLVRRELAEGELGEGAILDPLVLAARAVPALLSGF